QAVLRMPIVPVPHAPAGPKAVGPHRPSSEISSRPDGAVWLDPYGAPLAALGVLQGDAQDSQLNAARECRGQADKRGLNDIELPRCGGLNEGRNGQAGRFNLDKIGSNLSGLDPVHSRLVGGIKQISEGDLSISLPSRLARQ